MRLLSGNKDLVALLIANNADVNTNETPLDYAKCEITNLLRKHGGKTKEELEVAWQLLFQSE